MRVVANPVFVSPSGTCQRSTVFLVLAILSCSCLELRAADRPKNVQPAVVKKAKASSSWTIEIVHGPAVGPSPAPRTDRDSREAAAKSVESAKKTVKTKQDSDKEPRSLEINPAAYAEVYRSIPFHRSEYDANPNYRHEATMEILLGQPKPHLMLSGGATGGSTKVVNITSLVNPLGAASYYYPYWLSRPIRYWPY